MSINQVTLSGEVRKVFGLRQTPNGTANYSFAVTFKDGDRDSQVVAQMYGEAAENVELDEGDYVVLAGKLKELRWQDAETKEWNGRHDLYVQTVVNVSDLEGSPLDDE